MARWNRIGTFAAVCTSSVLGAYTDANPGHTSGCSDPDFGPVTGGVDYVDLHHNKRESQDIPETGYRAFSTTLNGYTFWFKNAENKEAFEADPWKYAPHCGAFCCFAAAKGFCGVGVDITTPVYTLGSNHDFDGTCMQLGVGPHDNYVAGLPEFAALAESNWKSCVGDDRLLWPFNTKCAARDEIEEAFPVSMSIVETAQATEGLENLVDALVQADLVDALSGPGPFTVFAPTNDAFGAISTVVAGLTKEQLQQVLEYHVVNGAAKSTDLTNMEVFLPLFSGHSLGVNLEEGVGRVRIVGENNAVTVISRDVVCNNGVVHVVDAVLVPNLDQSVTV